MTKNLIRDNRIWWGVKIIACIYQMSSTLRVFYNLFITSGRGKFEAGLDAVLASLLVDALFIAVLFFLETDEISTYEKTPMVLVGIGLSISILAIGVAEEGIMAYGPRIGVLGLIATDIFKWGTEVGQAWYQRHQYHKSREHQEIIIRDKEVIARKKAKEKALYAAFTALEQEFLQVQIERERRNLGLSLNEESISTKQIDFINLAPQTEEVEPGVFKLNDGNFAWVSNGELITSGIQGKPYATQIGASRARTRNLNRNGKNNGKSLLKEL